MFYNVPAPLLCPLMPSHQSHFFFIITWSVKRKSHDFFDACWNVFGEHVSMVVNTHFFSSDTKFILLSCAHAFFFLHFLNVCSSFHFHQAFFVQFQKCSSKSVDGCIAIVVCIYNLLVHCCLVSIRKWIKCNFVDICSRRSEIFPCCLFEGMEWCWWRRRSESDNFSSL